MYGKLNSIRFKRIPIVIEIMTPFEGIEQKISNPKYYMVSKWNASCCIFSNGFDPISIIFFKAIFY